MPTAVLSQTVAFMTEERQQTRMRLTSRGVILITTRPAPSGSLCLVPPLAAPVHGLR